MRRQHHHQGHPEGNDRALAEVEHGHGGLALDRPVLPFLQGIVVTLQFQTLVAEILDRLVVDQTVEGDRVAARIELIHAVPEIHAPLGDQKGEQHVHRHRTEHGTGEDRVVVAQHDHRHQRELHHDGQDAEGHVVQDLAYRTRAALQVTADRTGLAPQMKTQRELQQMGQHPCRQAAHRPVAHLGEHHVPQFVEQACAELKQPVGDQQRHRHAQRQLVQRCLFEEIDESLEHQRDADVGGLRQYQAAQGKQRAAAKFPQKGQHAAQVVPIPTILVDLRRRSGAVHHDKIASFTAGDAK